MLSMGYFLSPLLKSNNWWMVKVDHYGRRSSSYVHSIFHQSNIDLDKHVRIEWSIPPSKTQCTHVKPRFLGRKSLNKQLILTIVVNYSENCTFLLPSGQNATLCVYLEGKAVFVPKIISLNFIAFFSFSFILTRNEPISPFLCALLTQFYTNSSRFHTENQHLME